MIRLGVTGHRALAETAKLGVAIDRALAAIEKRFPRDNLLIVSALAEGADRLVVQRALARDSAMTPDLIVPLPRPREEYVEDFGSAASREEFESLLGKAAEVVTLTTPRTPRSEGYRAVADYLLSEADVLIALWDGRAPTNEVGTAAVVSRTRALGLPLAWIHAGNRRLGTMEPTTLGEAQGTVTFEGF